MYLESLEDPVLLKAFDADSMSKHEPIGCATLEVSKLADANAKEILIPIVDAGKQSGEIRVRMQFIRALRKKFNRHGNASRRPFLSPNIRQSFNGTVA